MTADPSTPGPFPLSGDVRATRPEMPRLADIAEARRELAFSRAPISLSISDLETGLFLDVNEAYCRLIEFTRDELVGRTSTEVGIWARPADRQKVVELIRRDGRVRDHEVDGVTHTGRRLVALLDADVVEIGGRRCLLTSLRDVTEQRRVERALRESEGWHRALIEHSPESVVLHRDNKIFMVNRAALDMIGATKVEQVVGQSPLAFVHADSQSRAAERIQRILAGAEVAPMIELRLVRLDGTVREVEAVSAGVDIDGMRSVVVLLRDQTERRAAERALRSSEEKFAKAFRASPDAVTISRVADGVFIDVNQGFLDLTGFSREEAIGHSAIDLDLWTDERTREEAVNLLRSTGHVSNFDRPFRMKDGSLRFCTLSAELVEIGGETCMVAVVRDHSARQAAAAALRESEERYRLVTEQTGQLVYDFDFTTRTSAWAGAVQRVTGYTPAEFAPVDATAWRAMIHPDDFARADAIFRQATERRQAYRARYRVMRKDRTHRTVEESGFFISNASGDVVRMLGVIEDVTERERLEGELLQSQKMETVGRLAGGVAHDFNNLLTVILGHLALLENDSGVPREWERSLLETRRAAEMASDLTRQLLTASRQQPLRLSPLDLREVAESMASLLGRTLGEDVELVATTEPDLPAVRADRGSIEQVLLNLCVNARDAMAHGGRIEMSTTPVVVDEAHVQVHPQARTGTFVRVTVRDTGSGIAPELMPRIFEPFFTTKAAGHGTGLGLATVYAIVQQHEGWLEVESTLGRGSAFNAYLPLAGEHPVAAAASRSAGPGMVGKGEVAFLVEDEAAVRKLVELILTRSGFRVITAGSGREAIDRWEKERPHFDLLITDVVMPERVSGRQLADRFRDAGITVPVIFMSGYQAGVLGDVSSEKNEYFIAKPFRVGEFIDLVRTAMTGELMRGVSAGPAA